MENQSKLPEYVGKKIVEALKQDENTTEILESVNRINKETIKQNETISQTVVEQNQSLNVSQQTKFEIPQQTFDMADMELPENVMMLVKLINQLPAGVSRQVGAQIIRQTIEAMGIPMKSVLSEAQYIQEDLKNSTQDCINTIEEYKNNIKILEQKISTYKKQALKLGELINLFVMTIR